MSYVKLVPSIFASTVWAQEPTTKLVWLTMLIMADRDGLVPCRAPGIARTAGVSLDDTKKALTIFSSPDPDSRTRDHEGRRAVETDDGWVITNYEKYAATANKEERDEKARERAKRAYERKKAKAPAACKLGICGKCVQCLEAEGGEVA